MQRPRRFWQDAGDVHHPRGSAGTVIVGLFALSTLVSAMLMFLLEPLLAKALLPLLGGAPAVWTAALVFFQTTLLVGYALAHALARLGRRVHAVVHFSLVAGAWLLLPVELDPHLMPAAPPSLRVIGVLTAAAGIPFLALAMNAPALGRQLARLDHPAARNPYVFYAASNAGSLFALIAYPFVIEPLMPLSSQARVFTAGYGVLVILLAGCAVSSWRKAVHEAVEESQPSVGWIRRLRWLFLAAVPSAGLVGVTQYLTTDVGGAPLFWLLPLFLYLLSFVLVFAEKLRPPHQLFSSYFPLLAALATLTIVGEANEPAGLLAIVHLLAFFGSGMLCHGELANDRPPPTKLTEFYFWMSAGGVIGGLCASLLAPLVFDRPTEYPLAIVLALLCRPSPRGAPHTRRSLLQDAAFAALILALMAICAYLVRYLAAGAWAMPLVSIPTLLAFQWKRRPVFFALAMGAAMAGSSLYHPAGIVMHRTRNFLGALRVTRDTESNSVRLVHGNTIHGSQLTRADQRRVPTSYYHRSGPVGDLFKAGTRNHVGVIGLGAGTLAAYARASEQWTFFEINPAVVEIAMSPRWFTFLSDAFPGGRGLNVEVGDARLRLATTQERFDLLVVDAFNSDAIPVHLLTVEALQLYTSHLSDGGIIAWHISNKFFDLAPLMAALAEERGLRAWVRQDLVAANEDAALKSSSIWAVMARSDASLGPVLTRSPWRRLANEAPRFGMRPWTDDHSSIVPLLLRGPVSDSQSGTRG